MEHIQKQFGVTFSTQFLHKPFGERSEGVWHSKYTYVLGRLGNPECKDNPEETAGLTKRVDRGRVRGKHGLEESFEG